MIYDFTFSVSDWNGCFSTFHIFPVSSTHTLLCICSLIILLPYYDYTITTHFLFQIFSLPKRVLLVLSIYPFLVYDMILNVHSYVPSINHIVSPLLSDSRQPAFVRRKRSTSWMGADTGFLCSPADRNAHFPQSRRRACTLRTPRGKS